MGFRAEPPDRDRDAAGTPQGRHRRPPGEQGRQEARLARNPVEVEPPGRGRRRLRGPAREVEDDVGRRGRVVAATRLVGGEGDRLGRGGEARSGQPVDRGLQAEQQLGVRRQAAGILDPGDADPALGPLPELVEEADVPAAQGAAVEPHRHGPRRWPRHGGRRGARHGGLCLRPGRGPAAAGRRPIHAADRPFHQPGSLPPRVSDFEAAITALRILRMQRKQLETGRPRAESCSLARRSSKPRDESTSTS